MEQDRLRALFNSLAKKENTGRRQLELLREYIKQKDNPDSLRAFVDSVESEVVSGLPAAVAVAAKPQEAKPSITKTSVVTNAKLEARRQKVAALKAKREAEEAAAASSAATEAEPEGAKPSVPASTIEARHQKIAALKAKREAEEAEKAARILQEAKEAANKKAAEEAAEAALAAAAALEAKEAANKKAAEEAAEAALAAAAALEAKEAANKKAAEEAAEAALAAQEANNNAAEENEDEDDGGLIIEEEEVEVEPQVNFKYDPDILYTRDEPLLPESNNKPVVVRETLAQGDCFFSAIFRSAVEGEFYDDMVECLGIQNIDKNYEMNFVVEFRKKLADELRKGHLPHAEGEMNNDGKPKDIYTYLANLFETTAITGEILENTTYYQVILPQPTWLQKALLTDLLIGEKVMIQDLQTKKPVRRTRIKGRKQETFYTREEFLSMLISNIETPKSFVGETEVRIARRLLRACGIKLVIYNTIAEDEVPEKGMLDEKEVPRINLVNKLEGHYEYFSFILDDDEAVNFSGGSRNAQDKKRFVVSPKRKSKRSYNHTRKLRYAL